MKLVFIILISLVYFPCWSQQEEKEVGKTIDNFLRYLSFSDSSSFQVDSLTFVFVSEGKLTANFGKRTLYFTVPQYIESMKSSVRSGQLYSSKERELARKVDIFGKIAHVLSTYELTMVGKDGQIVRRGINSIQLLKQDDKWLILSLIWDRESDVLKIPSKYLSQKP